MASHGGCWLELGGWWGRGESEGRRGEEGDEVRVGDGSTGGAGLVEAVQARCARLLELVAGLLSG